MMAVTKNKFEFLDFSQIFLNKIFELFRLSVEIYLRTAYTKVKIYKPVTLSSKKNKPKELHSWDESRSL